MPNLTLATALQVILALGLLNVWLLRAGSPTAYRGGKSGSLKDEFRAYGLPDPVFYLVGAAKISAALALLAGLWWPIAITPAAALLVGLMLGALAMHIKVGDAPLKSIPAALMLLMSAGLLGLRLGWF